jgi:hypothetical protein
MTILLLFIGFILFALIAAFVSTWVGYVLFQHSMKPGDTCQIFVDEDRINAIILEINGDVVSVQTMNGIIGRMKSEIYPK